MSNLSDRAMNRYFQVAAKYNNQIVATEPDREYGYYQRYDSSKNKDVVKTIAGDLLYCLPASNGGIGKGEKVALYQASGATPYFKQMGG